MPAISPDFNHNARVTRRVRLDLPRTLPAAYQAMLDKLPYQNWLKTHIAEVLSLKNNSGGSLLTGIRSRMGQSETGTVFVTDFEFTSQAALDYYNAHYLAAMRGRIEESYPGATALSSPFAYKIALDRDNETFGALIKGIKNFQTIA
jgi:hypothetical protein